MAGVGTNTNNAVELPHAEGCPALRRESYTARRPRDGVLIEVHRCIDCGATNPKEVPDG